MAETLREKILRERTAQSAQPKSKSTSIVSAPGTINENDPAYIAARKKYIDSTPKKDVTDADYKELEDLYAKAETSGKGKTPETLAFQKRYHEILPDAALQIIAK